MAVILSSPLDRPGDRYAGTAYWRYVDFRNPRSYNPRSIDPPELVIGILFRGWVSEDAFNIPNAAHTDEYLLELSFAEFLLVISPVLVTEDFDIVAAMESVLLTKPGFESGAIA